MNPILITLHRAVVKENSTIRIGPVFDASAKEKGCVSLNDCLVKGPNNTELIPSILNRFLWGKFGVTADIRKAFLQFRVNENDRNFLRPLWWENGNPDNLKIFRHRRVVFGVSTSAFLLGATVNHHLEHLQFELQKVANKLKESMFVDNCMASLDTENEPDEFIEHSKKILSFALFDLWGWKFNLSQSESCTSNSNISVNGNELICVSELLWNITDDTLTCDKKGINDSYTEIVTKRTILTLAN